MHRKAQCGGFTSPPQSGHLTSRRGDKPEDME
jgi:hypothetical protein